MIMAKTVALDGLGWCGRVVLSIIKFNKIEPAKAGKVQFCK